MLQIIVKNRAHLQWRILEQYAKSTRNSSVLGEYSGYAQSIFILWRIYFYKTWPMFQNFSTQLKIVQIIICHYR
jgi:hypothetical protein